MEKQCSKCGIKKPFNEFDKHNKRPDGYQTYCRICKKQFDAQYYILNKKKTLARNKKNKQLVLDWLEEYKSKLCCSICGESRPRCLDFHHKNPKIKNGNISNLVQHYSIKRLKSEIDKCEVLCANCHRMEHC